jgi:hypothetical protein
MKKIFFLVCIALIFSNLSIFASLPDLSVYWIRTDQGKKGKYIVGKEILIQCTTLKEGYLAPGSNWWSILKVNGVVIADMNGITNSTPKFGAWWPYQITKPGKNEIECVIDYKNEIEESDEINNKATFIFNAMVVLNNTTSVQNNDLQIRIPKNLTSQNPGDKANWTITRMESVPICYTAPGQLQQESIHNLTFEFKSFPDAAQGNELVISGKFVSSNGTISKPPLNLSAITSAWVDGGASQVDWNGHSFLVTKVNSRFIRMTISNFKITAGTTGDFKIFITAQSKDVQGIYYTDEKNLLIQPCATYPLLK